MASSTRSDPPVDAAIPAPLGPEDRERAIVDRVLALAPIQMAALEGPELRFTWANETLVIQCGVPRDRILGRRLGEVLPELEQAAGDLLLRVQRSGVHLTVPEVQLAREGRSPTYVHLALAPLPESPERTAGVVFTAIDITERKAVETERVQLLEREQRARADAELANRMKDEFLARVSHELATPLAAMKMWIHILRLGHAAHAAEALDAIDQCARQQSKLIEDLLDVARAISGKLRLANEPFDPAAAIVAAVNAMRPQAEQKPVHLESELEPGLGSVHGDKARIQQIATNLVSNAIKFTRPGGHVWVKLAREGAAAVLEVSDDGQGIAPEVLPHIFAPFRQGDGSITREHGGLGLGLSIVQQLVQLHGGTITAHSDGPGTGARFRVALPLLPEGARPADRRRVEDEPPAIDGVDVLVVDDDDATREGLALVLESFGARVRSVASAAAALLEMRRAPPQVLLCDIAMPVADGYSLIRSVRALDGPAATVPAAAITAHGRVEDRIRALAAGFQHHVAKPVEPIELAAVVAGLAGRTPTSD